jgi:ribonuclease-3
MKRSKKGITKDRIEALSEFQEKIGVRFRNVSLLNTALSHKSYVNEVSENLENNEKLEFLGDAFLGIVISDTLYNQKLYLKEGSLARIKSYVVSQPTLYRVGKEMGIEKYILLGKGEEKSGGRKRTALIGDSVEAVLGAYYLDAGFKQARKLVERYFLKEILWVEEDRHEKDYKSILQEYTQKKHKTVPRYQVTNTEGPDHKRTFYVKVYVQDRVFGPGVGESKKKAEQSAAETALRLLKKRGFRDTNIERVAQPSKKMHRTGRIVRKDRRSKYSRTDVDP